MISDQVHPSYYSQRNGVTNLDVTLDATGNVSWKSDVGSYSYHATKRRAVVAAGSNSYGYDANGSMVSRNGSTIVYASYNLPTSIASGANSSTFSYDAWRNRSKQVSVTSGSTETTIYVAGLFEKVTRGSGGGTAEYRHRINATPGTVAIHTRRATYDVETYYLHRDHLGSGELITNAAGAQVVKLSFSANGERRDTDWDGPVSSSDLAALADATRRGFTDHEHLDSVGLIHMNGRVYDPRIGRFLSRDPYIDGVASSQGANGYAYVWNNPLTRWDPTGYFSITHLDGIAGLEGIIVEATRLVRSAPAFSLLTLGRAAFGGRFDRPDGPDVPRVSRQDTDPDAEEPEVDSRCEQALPDGSTVANNVRTLVDRAMTQATNPRASDAEIFQTYGYWFARVREGGDWDYKRQPGGTEEIGNFNYGATGAVLFHRNILERAAGAIQLLTLPSASDGGSPIGNWPYGDQVQDQNDISAGVSAGCP